VAAVAPDRQWWEPEPTALESGLLLAIARTWADLDPRDPLSVSIAREHLGEVIGWAVRHWQHERAEAEAAARYVAHWDEASRYDAEAVAGHARAARTAPAAPALSNEEWDRRKDEAERAAVLRDYLRGV